MEDTVHLLYCSDTNYMMPTLVSAASAVAHSKGKICIHLVADSVPKGMVSRFKETLSSLSSNVTVCNYIWDANRFNGYPRWHGSTLIYARMVAEELFPWLDRIISVDGDTLWLGDPYELWRLSNDDLLFQASQDPPPPNHNEEDIQAKWFSDHNLTINSKDRLCCGLMILNLKKLRNNSFAKRCFDFLDCYKMPPFCEQMVMCYLGQGKIAPLPKQWGIFSLHHQQYDITKPCLIHYVQDVPWKRARAVHLMSDIVLLWHDFASTVVGLDMLKQIGFFKRVLKRAIFLAFKKFKGLRHIHPMVKVYVENSVGLEDEQIHAFHQRFLNMRTDRKIV